LLEFFACVELLLNKEPMASLALSLDFPKVSGESEAPVLLNLTGELLRGKVIAESCESGVGSGWGEAVFGALMASPSGVAEETRTRGVAAPIFAGCAVVVGLAISVTEPCRRCQATSGRLDAGFLRSCADSQATAGTEPADSLLSRPQVIIWPPPAAGLADPWLSQ